MLILNPMKKLQKSSCDKSYPRKKWQKNGVFDFYYCMQKFSPYSFFWMNFFKNFFYGFELSVVVFLDTQIDLFRQKNVFAYISTFC